MGEDDEGRDEEDTDEGVLPFDLGQMKRRTLLFCWHQRGHFGLSCAFGSDTSTILLQCAGNCKEIALLAKEIHDLLSGSM